MIDDRSDYFLHSKKWLLMPISSSKACMLLRETGLNSCLLGHCLASDELTLKYKEGFYVRVDSLFFEW